MKFSIRSAIVAAAMMTPAVAVAANSIAMHRDPGCGCCEQWAKQVRQQFGRNVQIIDDARRDVLQRKMGVPADLSSCHTAIVDGMAFEGHVPIADMKRVLSQHPKGVNGLAVPGMPMGSPGMEMPGMKAQPYEVIAFGPAGRKVFARH
jgi:hypothetical protein